MKIEIEDKQFETLLEYEQIKKRIRFLGIQLNVDYEKRVPVFIGVLNGCFIFMGDLIKKIDVASEINFVRVSSYEGDTSTGQVKDIIGLSEDLKGRDVIIVEDIIETGTTLRYLIDVIKKHKPASIAICTLLLKPRSLKVELPELKYVGFEIQDEFVVGYGLDYQGLGRNLNNIFRAIPVPSET